MRGIDGEIIVVDNLSTDASCEMVKKHFPDVILIENDKNLGFSKANNIGVQQASGTYVLILNPDTVVAEDTFSKILNFANKQKNLGILGVKLIDGTGHFLPESKRAVPTPKIAFKKLFAFSKKATDAYYASNLAEDEIGNVPVFVGAFMLINRELYIKVKGFDEDYFMFGEDIDLSYKILKKGYQNSYFPKTQIIHYKGESTVKNSTYLNNFYGAMRIFYQKHFKLNPLFDMAMRMGIWLLHTYKLLQLRQKVQLHAKQPKNILYIGNENPVYESLQKQFLASEIHLFAVCNTRVISRYDDLEKIQQIIDNKHIDKIVFDNQSNEFSKIIFYMTALKDRAIPYSIRPANCSFIIGSDDKNGKGEIVLLNL